MKVITRHIQQTRNAQAFTIVPLGDMHLGAAACDEALFRQTVKRIASDPTCYWIGMGDYADFIPRTDPRFSEKGLARWTRDTDGEGIVTVQKERFLNEVAPIAHKCLALLSGNHEDAIDKHYERNIYSEIVTAIKQNGKLKPDQPLALGYAGWLIVRFHRVNTKTRTSFTFSLHHGWGGARRAGAPANNLEMWLWVHDCDVALFGHTHKQQIVSVNVEGVTTDGTRYEKRRVGAVCGTFLKSRTDEDSTYAEKKGYMPMPTGALAISLKPSQDPNLRVQIRDAF